MSQNWLEFLADQGARLEEGAISGFDDPRTEARAALNGDVVTDLSHFGLIRVGGEDALNFLQGQFTNDVRLVSDEHSQLSAHCSPKGRILASFRLFRRQDAFWLRLPAERVEPTIQRLRKYILMSKVELEDAGGRLAGMGISGSNAPAAIAATGLPVPEDTDGVGQKDDVTVLRVPGLHPRFEIYGGVESLKTLWKALAAKATPVGPSAWALLGIHAGVPVVFAATEEAFVPQMVNMQIIGGVNFKKGCYPGQEVVARMQYLGKLKRRMYLAHVDTDRRPMPGEELHALVDGGQGAGKVVDAQPAPDGGFDLLAVIQIAAARENDIHLSGEGGPKLQLNELPYAFDD